MGNAFSSNNALVVHTNKPCYYVGETVEGIVALNCINAVDTSGIELEILGYEHVSYTGDDTSVSTFDDNFDSMTQRTFTGHSDFFRVAMPLGPPGQLQPGQYQFAFRFTLPEALPQSFEANRKTAQTTVLDSAEVAYKLRAHVAKSGFDIKGETAIKVFVRQPPAGVLPPVSNSAERQVTSCCTSQGSTSIQMTLDRGVLVAGSSVAVTVQAKNGTAKTFNAINVKLRRRVMVTTTPGSTYSRHANDTITTVTAQGLGPQEIAEGATARVLKLQLMPDLPPTAEGRIVQCNYAIEAELHGGLTVGSTKTQIPVRILSCPPYEVPVYQAPPEWKPAQVFPTVDVPAPNMPVSPQVTFMAPQGTLAVENGPVI